MQTSRNDPSLGGSLRPRGPVQLGIKMRWAAGATVVVVHGELDVLTAPKLSTWLDGLIRRGRGDVVIDLSEAEFIDSLGLHTLLKVQRRLSRQSRSLAVICGVGPVRHAIELARLEVALGVVSRLAEYELTRAAPSKKT
jgi:anti-sigma B factor antagonist